MATTSQAAWAPADKDAVARGELWFYQRCSICHLDRHDKEVIHKQTLAPYLTGVLRDASPSREAQVREIIKNGGFRMPGFQYGLDAKEIDELVAFLKTL